MPEQELYKQPGQQLALKFVKPDFVDTELIDPPKRIYRFDDRGNRYYYMLNDSHVPTFYGSVTSIIQTVTGVPKPVTEKRVQMGDEAFFRYVENRRQFGTFMHLECGRLAMEGAYDYGLQGTGLKERIERYAENNGVEYTGSRYGKSTWFTEAWKTLLSFGQFLEDYDVKPIAVEIPLADPTGYANTVDLWVDMYDKKYNKTPEENRNRERALIDIKTGYVYPSHEIQLAFNLRSVRSNYPEESGDIIKLYNWTSKNWRSKPTYYLKDQTGKVSEDALDHYLWMWKNDPRMEYGRKPRDIKLPDGRMVVGSDLQSNFNEISIEKFIQEKHKIV